MRWDNINCIEGNSHSSRLFYFILWYSLFFANVYIFSAISSSFYSSSLLKNSSFKHKYFFGGRRRRREILQTHSLDWLWCGSQKNISIFSVRFSHENLWNSRRFFPFLQDLWAPRVGLNRLLQLFAIFIKQKNKKLHLLMT